MLDDSGWYRTNELGAKERVDSAVLKSFRSARSIAEDSLAHVAREVGCSPATIKRYEQGQSCGWNTQGNIYSYGPIMAGIEKYTRKVLGDE